MVYSAMAGARDICTEADAARSPFNISLYGVTLFASPYATPPRAFLSRFTGFIGMLAYVRRTRYIYDDIITSRRHFIAISLKRC